MYQVNVSGLARRDLQNIIEYIREDLENPPAAERIAEVILGGMEALKQFPEQGRSLGKIIQSAEMYRYLVCEKYLIFYRFEKGAVYIDRILHGRQDYLRLLFSREG